MSTTEQSHTAADAAEQIGSTSNGTDSAAAQSPSTEPAIPDSVGSAPIAPSAPTAPPAKKRMSGEVKLFIGILAGAIILGGGAIWPMIFPGGPGPGPTTQPPRPTKLTREELIPPGSHIQGDPNAMCSLVVFSDFECPSCKKAGPELDGMMKKQAGKLNLVFRHFQAATSHRHSRTLGIASEAAAAQGKFFEMAGKLFDGQQKYEVSTEDDIAEGVAAIAKELSLNLTKFTKDIKDPNVITRYDRDQAFGEKILLKSTPSFFFVPRTGDPTWLSTTRDAVFWASDSAHYK